MNKIHWDGSSLLAPVPAALITCGSGDKTNVFTVAWTGIICSKPAKTYISVRPSRYSYELIKETREFTINLTNTELVRAVDKCGVISGRDGDKFAACGITSAPGNKVSCPQVGESPISLECRVTDIIPLGSHDMFLADIVGVEVGEKYIDKSGKLDLSSAGLIAYSHGEYYALGKKLGYFGFSVKKKRTRRKA